MSDIKVKESDQLVVDDEEKSKTRIWLRDVFESNSEIRQILEKSNSAIDSKQLVINALGETINQHVPEILDELLLELEHFKTQEPGLYLINSETGKPVIKLPKGAIYQPSDYIGEDGVKRKSKPILHPGISVPLVIMKNEEAKLQSATSDPNSARALIAILDPNSIIRGAKIRLQHLGYEIGPVEDGEIQEFIIGKEHFDPLQSKNNQFHRHSVFASVLAKRIIDMIGKTTKCEFVSITQEKNSKQRWYKVIVKFACVKALEA